jgi:hypothetical protein
MVTMATAGPTTLGAIIGVTILGVAITRAITTGDAPAPK